MSNEFNNDYFEEKSEFLHAMAHPVRLKILDILGSKKACVSEISEMMNTKQPNISQHLNILRNARIIKKERDGKMIFYKIIEPNLRSVLKDLDTIMQS